MTSYRSNRGCMAFLSTSLAASSLFLFRRITSESSPFIFFIVLFCFSLRQPFHPPVQWGAPRRRLSSPSAFTFGIRPEDLSLFLKVETIRPCRIDFAKFSSYALPSLAETWNCPARIDNEKARTHKRGLEGRLQPNLDRSIGAKVWTVQSQVFGYEE